MTAREFLDEVTRLADAATEGPWTHRGEILGLPSTTIMAGDEQVGYVAVGQFLEANGVFIARARTAVPEMAEALLRVLELHQPDDIGCCQGCGTNELGDSLVTHSRCLTVQAILGKDN